MECDPGSSLESFAWLAVIVVSACTLLCKKSLEGQERGWDDFALDVSKQAAGVLWAKLLQWSAFGAGTDDCSDRWLRDILGVAFALPLELFALCLVTSALVSFRGGCGDLATGVHWHADGNFAAENYVKQLFLWLGCVLCAEWFTGRLMLHLGGVLDTLSGALLMLVAWFPGLELGVVIVLTPCVASVVKVWLTDDFLRAGGSSLSEAILGMLAVKLPNPPRELPSWVRRAADLERPFLSPDKGKPPTGTPVDIAGADITGVVRDYMPTKVLLKDARSPVQICTSAPPKAAPRFADGTRPGDDAEDLQKPAKQDAFPELAAALAGMESSLSRAVESSGALAEARLILPEPPQPLSLPRLLEEGAHARGVQENGKAKDEVEEEEEEKENVVHINDASGLCAAWDAKPPARGQERSPLPQLSPPDLDLSLALSSVKTAQSESPQLAELKRRIADKNQELLALRGELTQGAAVGSADVSLGDIGSGDVSLSSSGPLLEQSPSEVFCGRVGSIGPERVPLAEQPSMEALGIRPVATESVCKETVVPTAGHLISDGLCSGQGLAASGSGAESRLDNRISSLAAKIEHLSTAARREDSISSDPASQSVIEEFLGEGSPGPCRTLF